MQEDSTVTAVFDDVAPVCTGDACGGKLDYQVISFKITPKSTTKPKVHLSAIVKNTGDIKGDKLYLLWLISDKEIQITNGKVKNAKVLDLDKSKSKDETLKNYEKPPFESSQSKRFYYHDNDYELPESGSHWLGLCILAESGTQEKFTDCESQQITIECSKKEGCNPDDKVNLTVEVEGDGKVTTSKGKDCSSGCKYQKGDNVILTAKPDSTFQEWQDANCKSKGKSKDSSICELVMDSDTLVKAVFKKEQVELEPVKLTVKVEGDGKVTFTGKKLECTEKSSCDQDYKKGEKNDVTLTAEGLGDKFKEWSKCPKPNGNECKVTMRDADEDVSAVFEPVVPQKYSLQVERIGKGSGTITSTNNSTINCGTQCKDHYDKVTTVNLKAEESPGFTFEGWGSAAEDCDDNKNQCEVKVNDSSKPTIVTAQFGIKTTPKLTVHIQKSEHSDGKVTSSLSGLECKPLIKCEGKYEQGKKVVLTAKAEPWSTFEGFGGDCNRSTTPCTVIMDEAKLVTAKFKNDPPTLTLVSPKDAAENLERNFTVEWKVEDDKTPLAEIEHKVRFWQKGEESSAVTLTNCPADKKDGGKADALFACTPSESDGVEIKYDTKYVLEVTVEDTGKASDIKTWKFTTRRNKPPYEVTEPSHEKGIEVDSTTNLILKWKELAADQRDPEGEMVTYDVFLWKTNEEAPTELTKQKPVCPAVSSPTTCSVSSDLLDYGMSYNWRVDGTDNYINKHGVKNITKGEPWNFETKKNQPPNDLINPSLLNGEKQIASPFKDVDPKLPITLSWEGGDDPDKGDTVAYTVEFRDDCSGVRCDKKEPATKSCTIPANSLKRDKTTCSYVVIARDSYAPEKNVKESFWNFTTMANQPPSAPINLVLTNEGKVLSAEDKVNPNREVLFSWDASKDPEDDEITYRLYVQKEGKNSYSEIKTPNISQISDKLDFGSYKWWVVAEDKHGNEAKSEESSFETLEAPTTINLRAASGYANTLLDWDTDATGIIEFRVLRVLHPKGSETIPKFSVEDAEIAKTDHFSYLDKEDLAEGQYCYHVEGLDKNGDIVSTSVFDQRKNCVTDGEVTLVIESTSGTTKGEVPIKMPNGGELKISTADICLKYDPDVLQVTSVNSTAFGDGYQFKSDHKRFSELGILKIQVEALGEFGEEAIMGPGALADVSFAVKEDRGDKDYSDLEWFEASENEDLVNQPEYAALKNCITIRDHENAAVKPLGLRDGTFTVRKATRDGQTTQARFYVRQAYSKGDVDGDGVVGTADARMATGMGVGYYSVTPVQSSAGDLNSDNKVNDADARVIAHYALHQEWLDNDKPPIETPKTRKRRDGKDRPIIISVGKISSLSGSQITTTLSVENLTDMTAMNLAIAYNTAVVEKAKVKKAGLAANAKLLYYDNKEGTVRIALNSERPINGSGVIAEITLTLASGGSVRSTPLVIAKTNLYDMFSRDFVISALQRKIVKQNGEVVLTDVEETVIERNAVEIPIEDIITVEPPVTANIYSITGRITDKNGNAIANVAVTVGEETVVTDSAGYYATIALEEGEYLVTARQTSNEDVFLEKTCAVANNESCRLDFVFDTGENEEIGKFAVYGTVLDKDGYPIKGATVQLDDKLTTTDSVGYFAFVGVFEGQYDVTVKKGTEELAEGSCIVSEETNCKLVFNTDFEQYPQEIEPKPKPKPKAKAIYGLQISVIDDLKNPIAGVFLQVGEQSVITDDQGYGEIGHLTEGEYTLTASKDGLRFKDHPFEVGNEQLWTELVVEPLTDLKAKIAPIVAKKAEQGKHFSYRFTVSNGGGETATEVAFEYQLPTGTDLVEIRGVEAGACEAVTDDHQLVCRLPDLAVGETVAVEIELDIVQPQSTLANTVNLMSKEYPVVVAKTWTRVKPYLSVFCEGTPHPIHTGGRLHYDCDVELNDNAPTGVATEVVLEMQIPRGVKLKSLATDYGLCDTSALPTITCELVDLTSDDAAIRVNLDVELTDPGLLVLINQASVKANEYPAHSSRERTKVFIPPDYKVDMVLVIDVTRSMQEEMNGVKKALTQSTTEFEPSQFPLTALVVFRDEVTLKVLTTDVNLLVTEIGKMKAADGGACPEASFEALDVAIAHVKDGGTVFLVTDASPYPDSDVAGAIQRLRDKGIRLNPMITGDCSNEKDWN